VTAERTAEVHASFAVAVNMSAAELEKWLASAESQGAGQKSSGQAESVGHYSGRKIVKLLRTKKTDLTNADLAHMRKVIGYVHRHLEQRPNDDVEETAWRHSLMNWGHDPLKK
jgi:ribosomal protein L11